MAAGGENRRPPLGRNRWPLTQTVDAYAASPYRCAIRASLCADESGRRLDGPCDARFQPARRLPRLVRSEVCPELEVLIE